LDIHHSLHFNHLISLLSGAGNWNEPGKNMCSILLKNVQLIMRKYFEFIKKSLGIFFGYRKSKRSYKTNRARNRKSDEDGYTLW
jgi:hypothetical protein